MYKCLRVALRNSAVPYDTSRPQFPSHLLAASNSSPIHVRVLQQVRSSCSVHVVNSVRSRVPSFLPSYSDRVRVHVSFHSLSQFYGSRNPRAPVSVVCLCFCLLVQRCSGASLDQGSDGGGKNYHSNINNDGDNDVLRLQTIMVIVNSLSQEFARIEFWWASKSASPGLVLF